METTYDVRIWKTEIYKGTKTTTYYVRWKVGSQPWKEPFKTKALAESFRSDLTSAARKGEAFHLATGLPVSMQRTGSTSSWYDFACEYTDMKWPDAAGKSRVGIAETLATVTPVLLRSAAKAPDPLLLRKALYQWSFNTRARSADTAPSAIASTVEWLQANTRPVSDLSDPDVIRAAVSAIGRKMDGTHSAASTRHRKHAVLHNALEYAVERNLLLRNPLASTRGTGQKKVSEEVDRRVVINKAQATALLDEVRRQGNSGPRLVAFFGTMYYSALRPAEAANLNESALSLPESGWGEIFLPGSAPTTGAAWSDNGRRRDERGLKHRAREAVRPVPCPPPLTEILRAHLREFGTDERGRLFRSTRAGSGDLSDSVYGRVWAAARLAALSADEAGSPLARRPYDLRHAAVSTWLNAGVDPTQIAEWAGHSVAVLLRVYAKCIAGQEATARHRIGLALGLPE